MAYLTAAAYPALEILSLYLLVMTKGSERVSTSDDQV